MPLVVDDLVRRLSQTERAALGAELPVDAGDAQALGHYAALVADAYALGDLDETDLLREMDEIARMTRRYADRVKGLPGVTADRLTRAALRVVFDALHEALTHARAVRPALPRPASAPALAMRAAA